MKAFIRATTGAVLVTRVLAGPYAPAAGSPGSDAVSGADPRFSIWANGATVLRGQLYNPAYPDDDPVYATFGTEASATGPADATPDYVYNLPSGTGPVVSLGDGGGATLTFAVPFGDAPGPDFAVFENGISNGFSGAFLELAHVEVSSDGVNFFRFPSSSLTPLGSTLGQGSAVDPTNVRNLAGKYLAGFGTPFDLAELRLLHPALDTQRITHVRVVDVVGTNDPAFASLDVAGNIIADPFPTPYSTGGFDLDAVGAFNATTTTYAAWTLSQGLTNVAVDADPDHNGVPNLIEYLTGNGRIEMSGTTLHFPRLAYRTGGNLKLEASDDLHLWTTLAQSINGAAMQTTGAATVAESGIFRKDVSVQPPSNGPWRFFRLAAELAP